MLPVPTPIRRGLIVALAALALIALGALNPAYAQTPVSVDIAWTNPTTASDGSPLTGVNAQTGVEVHWATATIPDAPACALPCTGARAAQVTLTSAAASTRQTVQATNGQTFYFRVKALSATHRSAFSNEATKVMVVAVPPGPPTGLRVDFVISKLEDGSIKVAALVREAWEETIYNGG